MKKKIVGIVIFAFICLGSVVYGAQNSNSSTTMHREMHGMNMRGRRGRKHWRQQHRRHRRHGHRGHGNHNT